MASFLFVLLVCLVCSLAAVGHGNHRQESVFASWRTPRALLHVVLTCFSSIWKNIFNSKFSILCILIMFFPLTQHLPDPSYLPIYPVHVLSQRREGKEEGKKTKQTNKKQTKKTISHWRINPTPAQAPCSGVAGQHRIEYSTDHLTLVSYKEFLFEKMKWGT